jgi:hypothetical protein
VKIIEQQISDIQVPSMYVRDLEGNEYPVQATYTLEQELNGDQTFVTKLSSNRVNDVFIQDIAEMWVIADHDGTEYKIKYAKKKGKGSRLAVDVKAIPFFFDEMDADRIYEEFTAHMTAHEYFSIVFASTDYQFILNGDFEAIQWEGVGKGETKLKIFKDGISRYAAEFTLIGTTVYLENQIGRDTSFMYRYKLNASNIVQEIDGSTLYTYAKGFGNYEQGDESNAKLVREYMSPVASIPGIGVRHAPPIYDGRITNLDTMDASLKALVDESLKVSVSASIHDLRNQGYQLAQPILGDRIFLIDERIKLDSEVRVVSLSMKKDWKGNILDLHLTFGSQSLTKRYQSNLKTAVNRITELIEGRRQLPMSALDAAVRIATKSLQSAQTELEFENGIIARDKVDPNHLVLFNSNGVGISRDGGYTFTEAITADGFALTAGAVGKLASKNIDVSGIIELINQGGYTSIDGGAISISDNPDFSQIAITSENALTAGNAAQSSANEALETASNAESLASEAQSTADRAEQSASSAQEDATESLNILQGFSEDSILSTVEKKEINLEMKSIVIERTEIEVQANYYGISPDSYLNAFSSLEALVTPLLIDMEVPSSINREEFTNMFEAYYAERQSLLKIISNNAKDIADGAQQDANQAGEAAQTAQEIANAAQGDANDANNQLQLWKYPGTSLMDGGNLYNNSVTTNKINAAYLSAISANLGTVNAGSITGVDITSSDGAGNKVVIDDGTIESFRNNKRIARISNTGFWIYADDGQTTGNIRDSHLLSSGDRGLDVVGYKKYIHVGFDSVDDVAKGWLRLNHDQKFSVLAGSNVPGYDQGRLYLKSTEHGNAADGRIPEIRLLNYLDGSSTRWSGAHIMTGRDNSFPDNGRFGFEVWQYRGTGDGANKQMMKVDTSDGRTFAGFYTDDAWLPKKTMINSEASGYYHALGAAISSGVQSAHGGIEGNLVVWYGRTEVTVGGSEIYDYQDFNFSGAENIFGVFVQTFSSPSVYHTAHVYSITSTGFRIYVTNHQGRPTSTINVQIMVLYEPN